MIYKIYKCCQAVEYEGGGAVEVKDYKEYLDEVFKSMREAKRILESEIKKYKEYLDEIYKSRRNPKERLLRASVHNLRSVIKIEAVNVKDFNFKTNRPK